MDRNTSPPVNIGTRLFGLIRQAVAARRKQLIVVAYYLSDQSSHHFNELLGYRTAAQALGLACRIIVPRTCAPHLAASLLAEPVLDPLPQVAPINAEGTSLTEAMGNLETLQTAIEAHHPRDTDMLLFAFGQPILIAGIGLWLARRSPRRRPSVFFRLVGDEFFDPETGHLTPNAEFFRMACAELRTRPGHERVFLLASSSAVAHIAARVGGRRVFQTSVPKHLVVATESDSVLPARPTVHVHLNCRSGRFVDNLGDIIRLVTAVEPATRFIVKSSGLPDEWRTQLESEMTSQAEMLPAEQDTADYLANFSKCTVVLLGYEKRPYGKLTSGVFVEAASFGKPVVVPNGTWMAQQIATGCGVGTIFEEPSPNSVAAALLQALGDADKLSAAARAVAPRMRAENSSKGYIEKMMKLLDCRSVP